MDRNEINEIVKQVINKLNTSDSMQSENKSSVSFSGEEFVVDDITNVDLQKDLKVDNASNKDAYLKMKSYTSARLGVGRCGNRYLTESSLRFRADHAAAMDAVFSSVNHEVFDDLSIDVLKTKTICQTKDEYLTRPDFGKLFDDSEKAKIANFVNKGCSVQLVIGDGLSSAAIEANIKNIIPSIIQGLKTYNIDVKNAVYVDFCRVGAMDVISEISNADVTLLLVGERPGLITANSMSAYIAYKGTVGMPEARRSVISNIHDGGTPAVEAGAHIASVVKKMIDEKKSGVDLKL